MNESMVWEFLKALDVKQLEARGSTWVNGCCPMAPETHAKGIDHDPSFGVRIVPKGESYCSCFSCGYNANLSKLMFDLLPIIKGDPRVKIPKAYELIALEADGLEGYQPADEWSEGPVHDDDFEAFPDWWLDGFSRWFEVPVAKDYLEQRGVSDKLASKHDLRYDTKLGTVCFPYWDHKQRLAGMRGRFLQPKGKNKYHDYTWNGINNSAKVWYNEHAIDWMRPIVVPEGSFDTLAVEVHWDNTMSPWSCIAKLDMLRKLKKAVSVVCAFDNDTAGEMGYSRLEKILNGEVALTWAKPPEGQDFAELEPTHAKNLLRNAGLPV